MEFKVGDIVECNDYGLCVIVKVYRLPSSQILTILPRDGRTITINDIYASLYDPTRLELALNNHLNLVD